MGYPSGETAPTHCTLEANMTNSPEPCCDCECCKDGCCDGACCCCGG